MSCPNGVDVEATHHEPHPLLRISEVDHRVANSLSLIASTVRNQARHLAKQQRTMSSDEISSLLGEVASRLAVVGQLHREIASRPHGLHLDVNKHLWKLSQSLVAALAAPGRFELVKSATGPCEIETSKMPSVCLIVAEIVTNSLKYAHPAGVGGRIFIGCRRQSDGAVIVEVADDGVGFPDGFDPAIDGGLGSRTVALLAQQLGAEISFTSRPIGLCFRLRLPPSSMV